MLWHFELGLCNNISSQYIFHINNYRYTHLILVTRTKTHLTCLLNLKETYYSMYYGISLLCLSRALPQCLYGDKQQEHWSLTHQHEIVYYLLLTLLTINIIWSYHKQLATKVNFAFLASKQISLTKISSCYRKTLLCVITNPTLWPFCI